MSYQVLQLPNETSTERAHMKIRIQGPWNDRLNISDFTFLRSWFEYDSAALRETRPPGVNWNAILGLFLVACVSAGFWTGVGFAVARIWR